MMSNFLFLGLALATIAYSQSYAAVLAGSTLMVSRLQRIAVQCGVNHSPLMSRHDCRAFSGSSAAGWHTTSCTTRQMEMTSALSLTRSLSLRPTHAPAAPGV